MTHTIDTKAIQELAAMSPEAKAYLEREFPEVFYTDGKPTYRFTINDAEGSEIREATTEEIQRFIPDYKPNV